MSLRMVSDERAPQRSVKRYANIATLVLVNLLWAAQYPAYKIAAASMSPAALNFWTLLCSTLLLLPFSIVSGRRDGAVKARLDPRSVLDFVLLGTLGILPPSLLLSWGIARSTASNAAIIQLTIPVLMVVLAIILLGERLTALRAASLTAALAGTLLTSKPDLSGDVVNTRMLVGNVVILFSGLGSAFYNTYSKKLLPRFGGLRVLIYTYVVGWASCALISCLADDRPFYVVRGYPASVWLSIAVLGSLTWGVAMALWMWVLNRLQAGQASVSIYLLSIFGVLLSAITLGEHVRLPQVAGGLLVFAATYLTSEYESRREAARVSPNAE
jgi:drug/metabolite transporter (DMT)-like permease